MWKVMESYPFSHMPYAIREKDRTVYVGAGNDDPTSDPAKAMRFPTAERAQDWADNVVADRFGRTAYETIGFVVVDMSPLLTPVIIDAHGMTQEEAEATSEQLRALSLHGIWSKDR